MCSLSLSRYPPTQILSPKPTNPRSEFFRASTPSTRKTCADPPPPKISQAPHARTPPLFSPFPDPCPFPSTKLALDHLTALDVPGPRPPPRSQPKSLPPEGNNTLPETPLGACCTLCTPRSVTNLRASQSARDRLACNSDRLRLGDGLIATPFSCELTIER